MRRRDAAALWFGFSGVFTIACLAHCTRQERGAAKDVCTVIVASDEDAGAEGVVRELLREIQRLEMQQIERAWAREKDGGAP